MSIRRFVCHTNTKSRQFI